MEAHHKFPCVSAFICKYSLFTSKNQEDFLGYGLQREIAGLAKREI